MDDYLADMVRLAGFRASGTIQKDHSGMAVPVLFGVWDLRRWLICIFLIIEFGHVILRTALFVMKQLTQSVNS